MPGMLEDGENELSDFYRPTLHLLYGRLISLQKDIDRLSKKLNLQENEMIVVND
jgi:hypothetical protein